MSESELCTHRRCVIPKLLLLIKIASEHAPEGMTEDEILNAGVRSLIALGVSPDEVIEGTLYLHLESPFMSDIEDDFTRLYREDPKR